jgi:hypothetical protein
MSAQSLTPAMLAALRGANLSAAPLGTLRALAARGLIVLSVESVRRERSWGRGPIETTVTATLTAKGREVVS